MSQSNSTVKDENSAIEEFNSILENIIADTLKIADIIKKIENSAEKTIDITIIDDIDSIYKERHSLTEKLKVIFEKAQSKEKLVIDNPLWDRYNDEISYIETKNTEFLSKKISETKDKLSEITNNKSVLLYNPKVNLSYENRII